MPNMVDVPEEYFISATPYVPGSELPVLVYRNAVSHCQNEDDIKEHLEANGGWLKGVSMKLFTSCTDIDSLKGAWNAFFKAHYHPNVHECSGMLLC